MLRLLPDVDVKKGCRVTIDPDCAGNLFSNLVKGRLSWRNILSNRILI